MPQSSLRDAEAAGRCAWIEALAYLSRQKKWDYIIASIARNAGSGCECRCLSRTRCAPYADVQQATRTMSLQSPTAAIRGTSIICKHCVHDATRSRRTPRWQYEKGASSVSKDAGWTGRRLPAGRSGTRLIYCVGLAAKHRMRPSAFLFNNGRKKTIKSGS